MKIRSYSSTTAPRSPLDWPAFRLDLNEMEIWATMNRDMRDTVFSCIYWYAFKSDFHELVT